MHAEAERSARAAADGHRCTVALRPKSERRHTLYRRQLAASSFSSYTITFHRNRRYRRSSPLYDFYSYLRIAESCDEMTDTSGKTDRCDARVNGIRFGSNRIFTVNLLCFDFIPCVVADRFV